MGVLASPVFLVLSPIPTSDSGRPLGPSSHPAKALDAPMFMSIERLLEGQAPSAGVSSVVCVPRLGSDQGAGTVELGLWGNALLGSQLFPHIKHPFHQPAPGVSGFTE